MHPNNSIKRMPSLFEPPLGDSQDQTSNPRRGQCFVVMFSILGMLGDVGVVGYKNRKFVACDNTSLNR